MNILRKSILGLTGAVLMAVGTTASATPIQLITNGEFEAPVLDPTVNGGDWAHIPDTSVPGWACSSGECEIWAQGVFGSPTLGSDGLATGQHHEINTSGIFEISSNGGLLTGSGTGVLSFDVWDRYGDNSLVYNVFALGRGTIASGSVSPTGAATGTAWENTTISNLTLLVGDIITVQFMDTSPTHGGIHIDQVSLLASIPTPEPAVLGLLGFGLLGMVGMRRMKKTA